MRAPWNQSRTAPLPTALGGLAGVPHPNPLPRRITFAELRAHHGVVDAQYLASYSRTVPSWALPVRDPAYGVTWTWLTGRAWWAAVRRRRERLIAWRDAERRLRG